ncbi:MAG TPA: hypothetical protein VI547_05795, partial [Anaerolineales bacterium]|nr:hypothetical protein [Anaerolineales bacterium]
MKQSFNIAEANMVLAKPTLILTPHSDSRHLTLTRELPSDLDTPVSLYLKLAATTNGPSFLLESVTGGEQVARYSFIGIRPKAALVIRGRNIERHANGQITNNQLPITADPLTAIQSELTHYSVESAPGLPRFIGGMVGYLGYDTVRFFEPTLKLPLG